MRIIILMSVFLVLLSSASFAYYTNKPADFIVGQSNYTDNSSGCSEKKMFSPQFLHSDGSKLVVADNYNNRILVYNSIPNTNNATADLVVGQPDFYSNAINQGGACGPNTLRNPISAYLYNDKMIIADTHNHRVLIFNAIPNTHNAEADIVIGQTNLWTNDSNQGGSPNGNTLYYPNSVFVINGKLLIADAGNHRILIYNSIPNTHNASADIVIGQPNMVTTGPACSSTNLNNPTHVASDSIRLFISDLENNRVLIYNSIPTANGAAADYVIGQTDMTSNSANQGGACGANTIYKATNVWVEGTRLFIADFMNNRVLIFNSIPSSNNEAADMVIGQPDFLSNAVNQGGLCGANTLYQPFFALEINNKLLVADTFSNRVSAFYKYPAPTLSLISPSYAAENQTISANLIGTEYTQINSIKLVNSSGELFATNIVLEGFTKLSCSLSLDIPPGFYDVQVNVNERIATLSKGFVVLDEVDSPVEWNVEDLGQIDTPTLAGLYYGVAVGDGDNDGYQELFISNRFQQMSYLNYFNSYWTISKLPGTATGELYSCVIVCDGDGDGIYDVYGSTLNNGNHVYEFKSAGWTKQSIGALPNQVYALSHSDGDNDGKLELYAACGDNHVYQYKKDTIWNITDLGDTGSQIYYIVAGDGDSDGEFEVYTANIDHNVHQFKFNGSSWVMTTVGSGAGEMYSLAVGDGNRDGQREVFGANQDGKVYQFKWQVASWTATVIGDVGSEVYDVKVSDGDNDGQDEVYASSADGHIYQFEYTTQWTMNDLGSVQTPLYKFAIGDANNDNQFEVYTIGGNNHIYQFKADPAAATPTPTSTPIPDFDGQIISKKHIYAAPNPVRGSIANINIFTITSAVVSGKLYTTSNQEVLSFRRHYDAGHHVERLNLSNIANGVYLLLVEAKNNDGLTERVIKKIALVK